MDEGSCVEVGLLPGFCTYCGNCRDAAASTGTTSRIRLMFSFSSNCCAGVSDRESDDRWVVMTCGLEPPRRKGRPSSQPVAG